MMVLPWNGGKLPHKKFYKIGPGACMGPGYVSQFVFSEF
jgi:hypothetical protein